MLPGTGYFRALACPFHQLGFCERPYCHFRHVPRAAPAAVPAATGATSAPTQASSSAPKTAAATSAPSGIKTVADAFAVKASETVKKEPLEEGEEEYRETQGGAKKEEFKEAEGGAKKEDSKDAVAAVVAPGSVSLEQMVQDAVRKLLLGGGSSSSLLSSLDTSSIVAQVKKEQQEAGSDSDCVIEEEIPAPVQQPRPLKTEVTEEGAVAAPSRPKLYLPPQDCPVYKPTPIKELVEVVGVRNPSLPPSLRQTASLLPPSSSSAQALVRKGRAKTSYKKPSAEAVLGDLGDLSESEGEEVASPDVLGGILREGNRTGVLQGGAVPLVVSQFEEQVIKEKLKLARRGEQAIVDKLKVARRESDLSSGLVEAQCAQITSSSPLQGDKGLPAPAPSPAPRAETEAEKAERRLKEKEEEVKKLEEKRIMLENFYNARLKEKKLKESKMSTDRGKKESKSRNKSRSRSRSRHHKSSKKHSRKSEVSESEETSSEEDSDDSEDRHKKKSKKRQSNHHSRHKSSKHRHSSSSSKKLKRHRKESSSDESSKHHSKKHKSSTNKSSNVSGKVTQGSSITKTAVSDLVKDWDEDGEDDVECEEETGDIFENDLDTEAVIEFTTAPEASTSSPKVDLSLVDSEGDGEGPPLQLKVKSMSFLMESGSEVLGAAEATKDPVEGAGGAEEGSDTEFVAETGKSFMSAMDELQAVPKQKDPGIRTDKSSKSSHSRSSKSEHKSGKSEHKSSRSEHKSSKSDHKSSRSEHKSSRSEHKSSKSDHKSSRSDHKSGHKSSKSEHVSSKGNDKSGKSEDKSSRSENKSPSRKSSSSSRHKSGKSSSSKSSHHERSGRSNSSSHGEKSKKKNDEEDNLSGEGSDDDGGDLPDLSEELALLPDDMDIEGSGEEAQDDFERVADGLEDIFAGVEDDDELQKIFDSYKEDERGTMIDPNKRRKKPEEGCQPSSSSGPPGKRRLALGGLDTADRRPLHLKKPAKQTPAQAMHERYKKIQALKQQQLLEEKLTELTEEAPVAPLGAKKRLAYSSTAAGPPVVKSAAKQQLLGRQQHGEARAGGTLAVTVAKGGARTAHTPSLASVPRPLVTPDPRSKVPGSVRQRYLGSIIDECLKITGNDELAAYARAEKEEADCNRKASSRMIYLNLAVNCIKRLRTEAAEASQAPGGKKGLPGSLGSQLARQGETSHLAVLAGRGGTLGTWSIEKRQEELQPQDIDEPTLFRVMLKYILTEEQLVENGYPRPHPEREGGVLMTLQERFKPDPDKLKIVAASEDKRLCCRCGAIYRVDSGGLQEEKEACVYHWGRCFRGRSSRERYNSTGSHSAWTCCQGKADEDGCSVAVVHVTDTLDWANMRGFVSTLDKGEDLPGRVFALDCEMCNTTRGNELTRVTVVDYTGEVCYESLVLPECPIVDYNTRFSGITAEDMAGVTTSIREVQTHLLLKFSSRDILLGHSLESDLRALKLLHSTVVDTSVVFPHNKGPPLKRALRTLVQEHLRRIIQDSVDGHDSKEDALACLDLMKMKAVSEVRKLRGLAQLQTKRRDNYLTDPENVELN